MQFLWIVENTAANTIWIRFSGLSRLNRTSMRLASPCFPSQAHTTLSLSAFNTMSQSERERYEPFFSPWKLYSAAPLVNWSSMRLFTRVVRDKVADLRRKNARLVLIHSADDALVSHEGMASMYIRTSHPESSHGELPFQTVSP